MGGITPTEVNNALESGADIIKIFPSDLLGGPKYIKTLKSIFPKTIFVPTGGVEQGNLEEYSAAGASFVGIGSNLLENRLA